jgi:hypothetical protein
MPKKLPPIPSEKKLKLRKTLSVPGLLKMVRNEFKKIPEHRPGKIDYPLPDVLMSSLAMFGLKYPSLLQFDKARHEKTTKANLTNLYGVNKTPCDTRMREVLDPVNPKNLRQAYTSIHRQLQRQKVLESYQYLDGYIVSIDGTGQFASNHVNCKDCLCRNLRNGKKQYYHQLLGAVIVHPDKPNVLPLFPEAITRQDGENKNDCERNASKRLLPAIREAFPKLKIIVVEDALASNAPHIRLLEDLSFSYILVAKPSDHAYMFKIVEEHKANNNVSQLETIDSNNTIRRYNYINNIPLNASNPDLLVNFLEYWEIKDGKQIYHNTWITDIELHQNHVYYIMRGGRARFQIENETFNTLKNQGYNLEHNYGHGKQHLSTVLAMLMMLHFLIDQVQELACPLFKAAKGRFHSRVQLWETLRSRFLEHFLPSWEVLWKSIIYGFIPEIIELDTS